MRRAARAALCAAGLVSSYWDFAIQDTADKYNCVQSKGQRASPNHVFYHQHYNPPSSDLRFFLPFGQHGLTHVLQKITSRQTRSIPLRCLRSPNPHIYQVLDASSKKFIRCRLSDFSPIDSPYLRPFSSPTANKSSVSRRLSSPAASCPPPPSILLILPNSSPCPHFLTLLSHSLRHSLRHSPLHASLPSFLFQRPKNP